MIDYHNIDLTILGENEKLPKGINFLFLKRKLMFFSPEIDNHGKDKPIIDFFDNNDSLYRINDGDFNTYKTLEKNSFLLIHLLRSYFLKSFSILYSSLYDFLINCSINDYLIKNYFNCIQQKLINSIKTGKNLIENFCSKKN